jgi:diacylglycerol kinase (ATP)
VFSSESPAIVFVNSKAGSGRVRKHLPRVREVFEQEMVAARFVETASREELQDLARTAISEGNRVLLAMGGDGTVQGLAQEAIGHDVIIGIIPAGGGNDFAAALGLPLNPGAALRLMLHGHTKRVDVAQATTADGNTRIYLGGGGIGLDVETTRVTAKHYRRWPGKWRYVAAALHAYRGFEAFRVRAEFPGTDLPSIESDLMVASVLNTPTYGAGLRFAPQAQVDDGMLDVVLLEYLRFPQLMGLLPRLLRTGEIETSEMRRIQSSRVRLTPDRPCLFHGDGEIIGPAPVEIEVQRAAVNVLVPKAGEEFRSVR